MALLDPLTFEYFLGNKDYTDDKIRKIVRDYVVQISHMHDVGKCLGPITKNTLLVQSGNGILADDTGKVAQRDRFVELNELGAVLKNLFRKAKKSSNLKKLTKIGVDMFINLGTQMKQITSNEHCKWLLYAPCLLSDEDKLFIFVVRLNSIAKKNEPLEDMLTNWVIDWEKALKKEFSAYPELRDCYRACKNYKKNALDLLRCIRNAASHLDEKKKAALRLAQGAQVAQPRTLRADYSILLQEPRLFVEIINNIEPNFLDKIYDHAWVNFPCLLVS